MPTLKLYADRVKDTSTSTSTTDFTLSGTAPTGYQDFNTAFGTGTYFYYCIAGQSSSEWEVGVGTLSTSTNLKRDSVLASSNSGSLVNFSAGTKDVFCTLPAFDAKAWRGRTIATTAGYDNP